MEVADVVLSLSVVVVVPDKTESQSSTLVRRKTLGNLNCCKSFTELDGLANDANENDSNRIRQDNGNRNINHQTRKPLRRLASADASSEFSFFNPTYEPTKIGAKADKESGKRPVPLPRRKKRISEASDKLNDVFENVEVRVGSSDDNVHDECMFLSVSKDEVLNRDLVAPEPPASPSKCRKYYIPKKELSLLLKLTTDAVHDDKASFPNFMEHDSLLDVISNWLLGERNRINEADIVKKKQAKKPEGGTGLRLKIDFFACFLFFSSDEMILGIAFKLLIFD